MNTSALPTACNVAAHILASEPMTLSDIHSIIHHPRSLARMSAAWRPPTKKVRLVSPGGNRMELILAITRHRVGSRARARVVGYSGATEPAYLITVRVSDPTGRPVEPCLAEGWIRAIVTEDSVDAVHELDTSHTATYAWLVDSSFRPVLSPPSLFSGGSTAA